MGGSTVGEEQQESCAGRLERCNVRVTGQDSAAVIRFVEDFATVLDRAAVHLPNLSGFVQP